MTTTDEACKVKKRYKMWVDEAAAELQMDITALDVVHSKTDDKEYILEVTHPIKFALYNHLDRILFRLQD